MAIYTELGIRPVVNAAATLTTAALLPLGLPPHHHHALDAARAPPVGGARRPGPQSRTPITPPQ